MKKEVRFFQSEVRMTQSGDGLEGYAALFDTYSLDLGGFVERIARGAFSRALKENQDVRALVNHDPNRVLGRTKSGTLHLSEDERGLLMRVQLPETQVAQDLMCLVQRGDIDQCSFKFAAVHQRWWDEEDPEDRSTTRAVRELLDVDLFDVSAVTFPAYPDTTVALRGLLWPEGIPPEIAKEMPAHTDRNRPVSEAERQVWKRLIDEAAR